MFRDYFVLFSYPDFYGPNKTCDQVFDPDVAGRGVVSSIVVAAVLTTLLAICAPLLDGIAGYGLPDGPKSPGDLYPPKSDEGLLPTRLNQWLFDKSSKKARDRAIFYRRVLTRVMITLGDQQILTGIAILVSGYVRAGQNDQVDRFYRWRYRLIENHFFLIVYMACLSSSSHLAAVVTLKRHLNEHRVPAFIRLALIVIFALLLTVTICLAVPFGPPTVLFLAIDHDIWWKQRYCEDYVRESYGTECDVDSDRFLLALFYIVAVVAILLPYYIAIVNTFENWQSALETHFKHLWRIDSQWFPMHWVRRSFRGLEKVGPARFWVRVRQGLKEVFLFVVLGTTGQAFCWQMIFFCVSLMYVIAQRAANVPRKGVGYCDLSSGGTSWGFGQILPMILLTFPVISAVVAYFEVQKEMEKEQKGEATTEKTPDIGNIA